MMNNFYGGHMFGAWLPIFGLMFPILLFWSIFWKGLALWHASRKGEHWWFMAILVVNTAGILEIIYLFAILKLKFSQLFSK
jgi:hypothetical protein